MSVRFVSASLTDCGRGLVLQVLTDPASLENPEDVVVESHILLLSGKAPHVLYFDTSQFTTTSQDQLL